MDVKLKDLRKQDYKTAIQYAIKGMHLDWYVKNKTLLNLYGTYFWYLELNRATQIIAAYEGDTLAGILLADIQGESKLRYSSLMLSFIKVVDFIQYVLNLDRSFGTIITALADAGFIVNTVLEPKPDAEAVRILPRMAKEYEKPSFLIIKAYKGS